ncbi:hypothetical protein HZB90_03360 [archaeon]|nr:hypothetical protein [archaeon]
MDLGKVRVLLVLLAVFCSGWLLNTVLTSFVYYDAEKPFSFSFVPFLKSPERVSPGDHLKESQIHVYDDRVVIDAPGATWASFTDTNSMDPFFDDNSNSIELAPKSPDTVNPGDIISYRSSITNDLIVHRVISKGVDSDGVFYIVKGDNNPTQDPEKIRFGQIHGVLIGILY